MSIDIVKTLPEEQWREFVYRNPLGNIFHTPEMFEVYKRTKGHTPELWAALTGSEVLALFIPVRIALVQGPLALFTSRTVAYGGILYQKNDQGLHALTELLEAYKHSSKKSSLFTEMRNLSDIADIQDILNTAGFIYEDHLNYLIKLDSSPQVIFQNFGSRTRKNIRHGIRKGLVAVHEVRDRDEIPLCYQLISQVYRRVRVPLADISLFYSAFDILQKNDMLRFTVACNDGKPVCVSLDLLYKDVIYGWYGGTDRDYCQHSPGEQLMWNILEWGCCNGYRIYDFGGAGKPGEEYGVRNFKAKFGGDLVCYGRNSWVSLPSLFACSKTGYTLARPIFSHLGKWTGQRKSRVENTGGVG